jgi:hypothetical protein
MKALDPFSTIESVMNDTVSAATLYVFRYSSGARARFSIQVIYIYNNE